MNKTQCAQTLIEYGSPFGQTFLPSTLRVWHKLFSQYTWGDFELAVKAACLVPGTFRFPMPGQVEDQLRKIVPGLTMDPEQAVQIVESVAKRGLSWKEAQPMFTGCLALRYAINEGIYQRFRFADIDKEMPFVRKDLRDAIKNLNAHVLMEDRDKIAGGEAPKLIDSVVEKLAMCPPAPKRKPRSKKVSEKASARMAKPDELPESKLLP